MATSIETVTEQGAKAVTAQPADRLPLPRVLGYGIGDFGFNFYWFSRSCSSRTTTPTCSGCAARSQGSSSSCA